MEVRLRRLASRASSRMRSCVQSRARATSASNTPPTLTLTSRPAMVVWRWAAGPTPAARPPLFLFFLFALDGLETAAAAFRAARALSGIGVRGSVRRRSVCTGDQREGRG